MTEIIKPPVTKQPYGGGHVYSDANGRPVPSVTSILSGGVPKPALIGWSANVTTDFVMDHWRELSRLPISERYKRIRDARWGKSKAATLRGSQLHEAAEAIVQGKPYTIPADSRPQAEAYARFRDDWKVSPLATERIVASLEHGYAGTFDLLAMLRDETWLLDLKTNSSGIFAETGLQLVAYQRADWAETASILERLHDVQTGAVWLRPDGSYDLVPITTGEQEFRVFLAAKQIAAWSKVSDGVVGSPLEQVRAEVN